MEVPLVSLVLFFSCSAAVDVKKVNSSIFDDFQLLDKLIQQEICKMLKEANVSSKFHLDEKLGAGPDLCNDLSLENQEVESNLMLVKGGTSPMSKLDRIPLLESGATSGEDGKTKRYSFSPNLSVGNPTSTAGSVKKDSAVFETSGTNSTIWENTIFVRGEPSEVMATSWTNEDNIKAADAHGPTSSELSNLLDMKVIITNSNTPMKPNPTYSDQEAVSLNSMQLSSSIPNTPIKPDPTTIPLNTVELSTSIPNVIKFTSSDFNLTAKYQHSAKNVSGSTSCPVCFPQKSVKSSIPSIDEHSSGSRSTGSVGSENDLKFSTVNLAGATNNRIAEDFPTEIHILPVKKENDSSKSNTVAEYSMGQGYKYTPAATPKLCSECSTTIVSSTTLDDFFYNMTCLQYCRTMSATYINNLTSSATSSNQFQLTSTPISFFQPKILNDFTSSRSSSSSYSSNTTHNPELLPKAHGFMPTPSSSSNSSIPTTSSASYTKSKISYHPTSKSSATYNILKTIHNSSSESPTSSNISADTSATSSTNTFNGHLGLTQSITKFTYPYFPASFSTSLYETVITPSTESTTDFCELSIVKHYQSLNTTTSPKSTPQPWCSHVKLTVNPKSPRASRRRTKVYSAVGDLHSYAGFFNVNQQDNVRLFFWFFCNNKWRDTPLIVWLQGEPGQSSLHGLFAEHGPYYVDYKIDEVYIKLRKFSWTEEYNVLYLDSCVGCGFSTADHEEAHDPTYDNVSQNVYEALMQFFKIWHEMKSNDLYLAGSYGGAKYVPVIAHKIHGENAKNEVCGVKMNLKGLLIGGPYVDAATMTNYNDFLLANGIIDEVSHNEMMPLQQHAQELIRAGKYQDAIDFLNIHVYCLISQAGYEEYKDVRILRELPYQNIRNIFRSKQFSRMICIDDKNFKSKSDLLIEEIMPSVDKLMPNLLSNYKVLYYTGQFDLMAPYMLASKSLSKLEWKSIDRFYTTEMIQWCPFQNKTACPQGFYRNYQNLTHVMIRNAGHSVGETHSKSLFHLLKWFVEDKFQRYQYNGNWYE